MVPWNVRFYDWAALVRVVFWHFFEATAVKNRAIPVCELDAKCLWPATSHLIPRFVACVSIDTQAEAPDGGEGIVGRFGPCVFRHQSALKPYCQPSTGIRSRGASRLIVTGGVMGDPASSTPCTTFAEDQSRRIDDPTPTISQGNHWKPRPAIRWPPCSQCENPYLMIAHDRGIVVEIAGRGQNPLQNAIDSGRSFLRSSI